MSEINVNPPPESPERNSSLGMGVVLGVILAVVVVIAIVLFTMTSHSSSSGVTAPQNSAPSINVNVPGQQPGTSAGAAKSGQPTQPAPGAGSSAGTGSSSGPSSSGSAGTTQPNAGGR